MYVNTRGSTVQIVDDQKSPMDVVREIAADPEREDPFYVVDLSDVVRKHKIWKMTLPRVEPFYAVKCNDTTTVLEVIAALGTGFDCASKAEIEKVLDLGVDRSRIIYANPCKTMSFIRYAAGRGVALMTFDNEQELHKIKAVYPEAELVLRIRVDGAARCQLGIKFGVEPAKGMVLLDVAKELGLNVVGVSFHVGSGCEDAQTYFRAIRAAREIFDYAADCLGYKFTLLDIGGGYPGQKGGPITFAETAAVINKALDVYFPASCGVRLIAEPGRYYVASSFTLCANIIAKRVVQPEPSWTADGDGGRSCEAPAHMYYINDGVYGSFNCLLFDHAEVTAVPLKDTRTWHTQSQCSIWGPTCDSMDLVIEKCELPVMDVGDWLVFESMGAYTVAAASTFNGFQLPSLFYIASRATWSALKGLALMTKALLGLAGSGATEIPSAMKTGIDVSAEDVLLENPRNMVPEISIIDV